MDRFELIEKLRERADISYEEARDVLEQTDGDLLEAIVLLEKQGKLRQNDENRSAQGQACADADVQGADIRPESAADTTDTGMNATIDAGMHTGRAAATDADAGTDAGKKHENGAMASALHSAGSFLSKTAFHVTHKGNEIFMMPSWTFALLMLFFWHTIIPLMLISLLFNVRYSFDGSEDTAAVNEILDKAGSFADGFESSMKQ